MHHFLAILFLNQALVCRHIALRHDDFFPMNKSSYKICIKVLAYRKLLIRYVDCLPIALAISDFLSGTGKLMILRLVSKPCKNI